jgi:hypothetical protein
MNNEEDSFFFPALKVSQRRWTVSNREVYSAWNSDAPHTTKIVVPLSQADRLYRSTYYC